MTKEGFDVEGVDTTEALPHSGVRVVIKNARSQSITKRKRGKLRKYLAKMFAIRIGRGTKIFLDGSKITAPEGFESKAEYLFTLE